MMGKRAQHRQYRKRALEWLAGMLAREADEPSELSPIFRDDSGIPLTDERDIAAARRAADQLVRQLKGLIDR